MCVAIVTIVAVVVVVVAVVVKMTSAVRGRLGSPRTRAKITQVTSEIVGLINCTSDSCRVSAESHAF